MFVCRAVFIEAVFDIVENVSVKNHPGNLISTNLSLYGRAPKPISGNVTFLKDLTDKYRVLVDVKKTSGLVLDFKGLIDETICTFIKKFFHPYIKTTLKEGKNTNLDFRNGKVCPLPKGTYWFKDITIDINRWKSVWWVLTGSYNIKITVLNEDGSPGGKLELRVKLRKK
ncbi:hypothetical protein KR084_009265 [Drosophila pseudotakahashii]|nr:hypothetical protein KR084_009265 [Drosophila pseudotakahashii]